MADQQEPREISPFQFFDPGFGVMPYQTKDFRPKRGVSADSTKATSKEGARSGSVTVEPDEGGDTPEGKTAHQETKVVEMSPTKNSEKSGT